MAVIMPPSPFQEPSGSATELGYPNSLVRPYMTFHVHFTQKTFYSHMTLLQPIRFVRD